MEIYMKINKDVVEKVAHLARLELKADEIELYTEQLDRILAYMDKLNSLDTTGIEPTTHAIPLTNVFREDAVNSNFQVEESVGNAPERKGSFFKVPPIIEVD
jgi:aspartyl-tRNA(Asn)/glutamyl-tRNA(Gln) amidotransferase subunit C